MAHIVKDSVLETSTTTGAGDFTLSGAVTGYRTFASVCSINDTFPYYIEAVDGSGIPTGSWETGIGTYSGTNTLTRTLVLDSSNSGSAVSFASGTKRVAISAVGRMFGWAQIASASPTGVSSVDFANIPATFNDLLVVVSGASHNNGSNTSLTLALSADGSTFATGLLIGASSNASVLWHGSISIPKYSLNSGAALVGVSAAASSPSQAFSGSSMNWRVDGGITAIRLAVAAGNFDAGTITLYGR